MFFGLLIFLGGFFVLDWYRVVGRVIGRGRGRGSIEVISSSVR